MFRNVSDRQHEHQYSKFNPNQFSYEISRTYPKQWYPEWPWRISPHDAKLYKQLEVYPKIPSSITIITILDNPDIFLVPRVGNHLRQLLWTRYDSQIMNKHQQQHHQQCPDCWLSISQSRGKNRTCLKRHLGHLVVIYDGWKDKIINHLEYTNRASPKGSWFAPPMPTPGRNEAFSKGYQPSLSLNNPQSNTALVFGVALRGYP